jgi:hypothetical protein
MEPITIGLALAGIQKAVELVKQASQTVDDVASLGPVLGKYFAAKETAVHAAEEGKKSNNPSNMSVAIEIEMAIEQTRQFEAELQMMFMMAGKIDVWNKIKARAGQMDQADKYAAQAAADRAKAQKKEQEEFFIVALVVVLLTVLGVVGYYFVQEAIEFAKSKPAHLKKLHA